MPGPRRAEIREKRGRGRGDREEDAPRGPPARRSCAVWKKKTAPGRRRRGPRSRLRIYSAKLNEHAPDWTKLRLLFELSSAFFRHSWVARSGLPSRVRPLTAREASAPAI